ncbi:MAG TPA: LysR family transcriptional regulator [Xanthobacteraceae bacterium]
MDRLNAMAVLVAVADAGSLSAAGRKLGIPLPTVSRKLSELETHLKTRLFIRSTRKLALTEAGAAYLPACKLILEQIGDAERAASGEYLSPRGDVVVTAPIVFGRLHVLPAINEFLASYPEIDVRLVLSDRNVHLIDDHVDLAVRIGALRDSSMMATRVASVRRVVCASPGYLAGYGTPKVPDHLSTLACITFDSLMSSAAWRFTSPGSRIERSVPIRSRLSVNTAEAAIDAAIAGVGLTRVLSYQGAKAVAERKLKIVLAKYEPDPLPVSLVHLGRGRLPLKTRAFVDSLASRIRQRATKTNLMMR